MSDKKGRIVASGIVLDANGRAVAGALVHLVRPLLRGESILAQTRTNSVGRFGFDLRRPPDMSVTAKIQLFARLDRTVVVPGRPSHGALRWMFQLIQGLLRWLLGLLPVWRRAGRSSKDSGTRQVRSPLLAPDQSLDLVLRFGPPAEDEYSALLIRLRPLLGRLELYELIESEEQRDLSYLARETGVPAELLMHLHVAERLGRRSGLPAALFYAFLRAGMPASLPLPLLAASDHFRLIEPLTEQVGSLIIDVQGGIARSTLEDALRRKIIPNALAASLDDLLGQLEQLRETQRLDTPFATGSAPLRSLLEFAGLADQRHPDFVAALARRGGDIESFWRSLVADDPDFDAQEVVALRRTFEIGSIVHYHLPAIRLLGEKLAQQSSVFVSELARLGAAEWIDLLDAAGEGFIPAEFTEREGANATFAFAGDIHARMQRGYPTVALAAQIERRRFLPEAVQDTVDLFFRNSPDLDLTVVNLGPWLEEHRHWAFAGIDAQMQLAVVEQLQRVQRALRIANNAEVAAVLLITGLDSGARIQALGERQVVHRLQGQGLAVLEARRVYRSGSTRYGSSLALYAQFNFQLRGIYPSATGPGAPLGELADAAIRRNPSLTNLFGSQDVCAVDPCTSMLSPAAYLVDLLQWLRARELGAGVDASLPHANALEAFADRRPDVLQLKLDCDNSHTPLPYIDLVNELLEDAVSPPEAPVWRQTTWRAAELRAAPEHINDSAYALLAEAVFPHHLPYDRNFDELNTVLARSKVTLWQLREARLPLDRPALQAELQAIAAARFGIAHHEGELISRPDHRPLPEVWNSADPANELRVVADFLQAAQLDYDQLLQLLACYWPRAGGVAVEIEGRDDGCDTILQNLTGLTPERMDRLHRFLRLWRRTGWAMWELDDALLAFGADDGALDDALYALFVVDRVRAATGLSIELALCFWQDIGTRRHRLPAARQQRSLYARIFEDPLLPPDPALGLETLLAGPPARLADHLDAVRAALELTPEEADALAAETTGELSLAALSAMHRAIVLARALRLSLPDAGWLAQGPLAGVFLTPETTLTFIRRVEEVQAVGLDVAMLRHVLTPTTTAAGRAETALAQVLRRLRGALQQLHDDVHTGESALAVLSRQLGVVSWLREGDAQETAIAIIDGSFEGDTITRESFITENFGPFMDVAAAQRLLMPPPDWDALSAAEQEARIDERAVSLLDALERWLIRERVQDVVADGFGLTAQHAELLLDRVNLPTDPPTADVSTLLAALSDPLLNEREPDGSYRHEATSEDLPSAFTALRLLDKMAVVVRGLRLSPTELAWQLEHASVIGGVVLSLLPVMPAQADQSLDAWLRTTRFLLLDRSLTARRDNNQSPSHPISSLGELLAAVVGSELADENEIHQELAGIAGWRRQDVAAAATALGVTNNVWRNIEAYEQIRRILSMAVRAGGSASQLLAWGDAYPAPTALHAEQAWLALRSHYSSEEWLRLAPDIMDPLRIRRRDALSWCLIGRGQIGDVETHDSAALFSYFLIDTEMSPCQVSTRVIQGYAAVQLFVQRALMNLERNVPADLEADDGWAQWAWMSRYRVWEASRKVFLWPENWLIESQRPDRSEIFVSFDRDAQQRDSTSDNLETAAQNYLDALEVVARLEVSGMCIDPGTGILYVVGRTGSEPTRYFLRTFANGKWSAWARIPHDISTPNLVPAFYAGRLHLFWVQTFLQSEPQQRLDAVDPNRGRDSRPADQYIELRVYFSALRDAVWTPPQSAPQSFFDKPPRSAMARVRSDTDAAALYTLKTVASGTLLYVDLYRTGVDSDGELGDLGYQVVAGVIAALLGVPLDEVRERLEGASTALDLLLNAARQLGRATFDGRFGELQLRNAEIDARTGESQLLMRARERYGLRAVDLTPLRARPDLIFSYGWMPPEPHMRVQGGALVARRSGNPSTVPLRFEANVVTETLLGSVPLPFRVVGPSTDAPFHPHSPFALSEPDRSWFIERRAFTEYLVIELPMRGNATTRIPITVHRYMTERFDHPFIRTFRHVLSARGFDGFYEPLLQRDPLAIIAESDVFDFRSTYDPHPVSVRWRIDNESRSDDSVDFGRDTPTGIYNWELFYHLPLFVSERLRQNQRFDEARQWLHYIFDPTRASGELAPQRFWITRPLAELTREEIQAQRINRLLELVSREDEGAQDQAADWRRDPFNPYLLAEQRPVAHMKRVVMSYLDILIDWGDALFATASREALNEATQLYLMAAELLGPKPHLVPPPTSPARSWAELEADLDAFSNAFVEIENLVDGGGSVTEGGGAEGESLPGPHTFYFKVPPNDKLLSYWDKVEDRLFKLRHCLGLGGEPLALPLFDAPIDPALLVRARAAGVDIGRVLLDLGAPMPGYRFSELHGRAVEYATAVQGLGQQLLAAIEARDAESLATLLHNRRQRVHAETRQVLELQIEEADTQQRAIEIAIELAQYQYEAADSQPFMSELEEASLNVKYSIIISKAMAAVTYIMAGGIAAIPNVLIGVAGLGGSPQSGTETGGTSASKAMELSAKANKKLMEALEKTSEQLKTLAEAEKRKKQHSQDKSEAGYRRREAEAQQQAAHFRRLIAEQQLVTHDRVAEDLDAEYEFMQMKFGNEALYDWMVGQLSSLYFSAFRLAEAMARRAERCYRFELGLTESRIIGSNHWDSLRRGLLAGEGLANDLRRLESSYLEQNVRRKEITRTVSLRNEFPDAFLLLLVTGVCDIALTELLFDRDYPGHYQRRITRASITVERPAAKADDNVVCVATLLFNSVRLVPSIGDNYTRRPAPDADSRFVDGFAAVQGIVTGNAIDDPGLFIRDIGENLVDPRYLPFENAGAISEWRIELPADRNALDLTMVTDVKLHLHYTAMDGGRLLRDAAQAVVAEAVPESVELVFEGRSQLPEAWADFMAGRIEGEQRFLLPLRPGQLPPVARGRNPRISACDIYLLHDDPTREFQVSLLPGFPTARAAVERHDVMSHYHFDIDPGVPLQDIMVRVAQGGAADWASLAPELLSGMVIAVRLTLSRSS